MMKTITFENTYILGYIVNESEQYRQYHYPEMLCRYDSNFIALKQMPTLIVFRQLEQSLRAFHRAHGQQHLKFIFPPNKIMSDEIANYMKTEEYDIGFVELYAINPKMFSVAKHSSIDVQLVSDTNMEAFLKLQYEEDLKYGETFAKEKQELLRRQYDDGSKLQMIAYYEGNPAGCVEVIERDKTVEIDNFFVAKLFRYHGVGGQIQRFVMELFVDKTVILLADGEDTAREMYQKQGYEYLGFRYDGLKVHK